jgi:hypothetical protein
MRKWKHTINLNQHIGEEDDNQAIEKAARGCISELEKLPMSLGVDLAYFICLFDDVAETAKEDKADEGNEFILDEFNRALDKFYDWADDQRIWTGG